MDLSTEEIREFKNEALELLDEAEQSLLSLEKGGDFSKTYAAVFRVFHSLKGGAGMLGLQELQSHRTPARKPLSRVQESSYPPAFHYQLFSQWGRHC